MDLADKTVVITGGSRGMGRWLAVKLCAQRANVVVNYRQNADLAAEATAEVIAAGGRAVAIQGDIGQTEDVQALIDGTVAEFGAVDVVVANAAASAFKPLSGIHAHHIDKTMAITVQGFLDLVRVSTPHMAPGGRFVAVSGWDSFRVLPGHGLLGAAKAAMETIVKYLAVELGPQGITTVGVCPGPVDTDSFRYYAGDQWDAYEKYWLAFTPSHSFPTPDQVADVMAFFCSPAAAAVNGQTIVVDGGLSLATMPSA